jgi:hypothetical protein
MKHANITKILKPATFISFNFIFLLLQLHSLYIRTMRTTIQTYPRWTNACRSSASNVGFARKEICHFDDFYKSSLAHYRLFVVSIYCRSIPHSMFKPTSRKQSTDILMHTFAKRTHSNKISTAWILQKSELA